MKICRNCGYVGNEKSVTKGSFGLEIALWILGFLTVGIFILIALPYTIWRLCSGEQVCPKCKSNAMIPLDTPMGKKIAEDFKIKIEEK